MNSSRNLAGRHAPDDVRWLDQASHGPVRQASAGVVPGHGRRADTGRGATVIGLAPHQFEARRRQMELAARVEDAAAYLVESRMPAAAAPARRVGIGRLVVLLTAAAVVASIYVGIPLALVANEVLGALPQALLLAGALLVLGTVVVLMVLQRTATALGPQRGASRASAVPAGRTSGRHRAAAPAYPDAAPAAAGREWAARPRQAPPVQPHAGHGGAGHGWGGPARRVAAAHPRQGSAGAPRAPWSGDGSRAVPSAAQLRPTQRLAAGYRR